MKLYTSGEGDVLRYYQHFLVLIKSPLDSCRLSEEERHSECFGSVSSPRIAPYSFFPHLIAKPNRQEYPSASRNCLFNFAHDVFTASPFFSHSTSGMTSRTREAMVPSDFPNVGQERGLQEPDPDRRGPEREPSFSEYRTREVRSWQESEAFRTPTPSLEPNVVRRRKPT